MTGPGEDSGEPRDPKIDQEWLQVVKHRIEEIRSGQVEPIPAEEVFAEIDKYLSET